jgi:hypothetical protein
MVFALHINIVEANPVIAFVVSSVMLLNINSLNSSSLLLPAGFLVS